MSIHRDKDKEARQVLRKLFTGASNGEIFRDDTIQRIKIKPGTWNNYTSNLTSRGWVERIEPSGARGLGLRLTSDGWAIQNTPDTPPTQSEIPKNPAAENQAALKLPDMLTIEDLDKITELTDKFNSQSKYWQWKFINTRELPMQQG